MFLRVITVIFSVMLVNFVMAKEVGRIKDRLDVELSESDAPRVDYKKSVSFAPRVEPRNQWIVIRVEFETDKDSSAPFMEGGKRGRVFFGGSIDDVELSIRVLMDTPVKRNQRIIRILFTGTTEFYSVRCDGKKHLAVMFIPAKMIDRYAVSSDGNVKRMSKNEFAVEAVMSRSGKVLARGYKNAKGIKDFEDMVREVPENLKIVGGVFPRSRTPWAWVDFDGFDLEKEPQSRIDGAAVNAASGNVLQDIFQVQQ